MSPSRRIAIVAALLLLAGCASPATPEAAPPAVSSAVPSPASSASMTKSASPQTTTKPEPTTAKTSSTTVKVAASLKFSSTTVDGRAFDGATLAGQPVLLWFWAPWCPICRGQIDQVQQIARDFDGKVNVIGVGSLDDAKAIARFADDAPGMTHLSDASGEVFRHFEVVQQSSFVLLDAEGEKAYAVGYGGSRDLADRVADVAG